MKRLILRLFCKLGFHRWRAGFYLVAGPGQHVVVDFERCIDCDLRRPIEGGPEA